MVYDQDYKGVKGYNYPENGKMIFQDDFAEEQSSIGEEIIEREQDIISGGIIKGGDVTVSATTGCVDISYTLGRDSQGRRVSLDSLNAFAIPDGQTVKIVIRHVWVYEDYQPDGSGGQISQRRTHSAEFDYIPDTQDPTDKEILLRRVSRSGSTATLLEDLRICSKLQESFVPLYRPNSFDIAGRARKNGSNDEIIWPVFRTTIDGNEYYTIAEKILGVADLDTGSSYQFGSDYFVWAGKPVSGYEPVLKISLSQTSPGGMTNPKIVGGFHYGKIRNSITISDVSDGLIPNSCWDLNNMPRCYLLGLADPSTYQLGGMVEVIPGSLWVDIYLVSDGGGSSFDRLAFSKINQLPLSGTDGLCWYDFVIRAKNAGKKLLSYAEWTQAAIGSPQGLDGSNTNGWTKTSNTGIIKTAATEAADADADYINGYNTSLLNVRDCTGNIYEWISNISNRHDSTTWSTYNVLDSGELSVDSDFGRAFLPNSQGLSAYIVGGNWSAGVNAGSRSLRLVDNAWVLAAYASSRFACDSL